MSFFLSARFIAPPVVTDGMTLYLDADDSSSYPGSGSKWFDISGNGYHANGVNDPSFFSDGYVFFDGQNDYFWVETLNYGGGNTISEMSVFAWMRTFVNNTSDSSQWAFLDFDRSEAFNFYIHGDGRISMSGDSSNQGGIGGGNYDISGNGYYNDGEWHYIGLTFSVANQEIIMYADGEVDATFTADGSMTALGNGSTRYGIIGDGSEASSEDGGRNDYYYQGDIGEIHFYDNKVLTLEEINQNYDSSRKRFERIDSVPFTATGGTVTDITDGGVNYRVHTFTSSGTLNVQGAGQVEYLVVGGGGAGAGGNEGGGGGGAGGFVEGTTSITAGSNAVIVGSGGVGNSSGPGTEGGDSEFNGITALGGGRGGGQESGSANYATSGGSGGGSGGVDQDSAVSGPGGSGLQPGSQWGGFGNDGGTTTDSAGDCAGGGGGAGEQGYEFSSNTVSNGTTTLASGELPEGPPGGNGRQSDITGSNIYYAGGGAGGSNQNTTTFPRGFQGGLGGGGNSVYRSSGQNGTDGLGGGGGGGSDATGGDGGSGVVIIRYPISGE